ncbi:MAG: anion permease [Bacteroidota bacterium]
MTLLIIVIFLALAFDFINGFHDAANSIATVVSTKVLSPVSAVIWAALFNFVAFFIFKDHSVANTIAKTVQDKFTSPDMDPLPMIFSGLLAAIAWNLITWWYGIPSSSSHTLIGGFAGAFLAAYGFEAIRSGVVIATAMFIVIAPLAGMIMAYLISIWFLNSFRKVWWMKVITLSIIFGTCWAVWNTLEFKKDFNGGALYKVTFETPVKKDELKKALTFKDEAHYKEYIPVIGSGKDSAGVKDTTGIHYVIRTDYLKQPGAHGVSEELSIAMTGALGKVNVPYVVTKSYTITTDSPLSERYDSSNLKNNFETYWLKVMFHGANFKWILLGSIVLVIGLTALFLSTLNVSQTNSVFKRLQLFSSAAFSIGHGGNDAQKVMGIIGVALIASGQIGSMKEIPNWVPLACYTAIAAGTLSGGWKIVKTMGGKITKVTPFEGVAAETAGAITLFFTEGLKFPWKIGGEVIKGIPVSTTHTITGSIIGVGATRRLSAVRWGVTVNLLWAWILTIPVSALIAAITYKIVALFL